MKIINIEDKNFPDLLRKIKKPPKRLYVLGDETILNNKSIAIVGSRVCTEYGKKEAQKFSKELTNQKIQIVSGMAKGIDTFAHKSCISEGGKTIAVLGCGFNNIYPKENKELFKRIIDYGGAVISEYPPLAEPSSDKFRERNRIVCGLSIATLIIEAAYRSGTSITARYTMEQGKPVFCIPNSLDNNKGVGTNELLKKGAILTTCIEDILNVCNIPKIKIDINKKKLLNDKEIKKEYQEIYCVLKHEPTNLNDICKKLKLSISDINSKLLFMEMDGIVKKVAGNAYIKI